MADKNYPNLSAALVAVDVINPQNRPHINGDTCTSRSDLNEISVTVSVPAEISLKTDMMAEVKAELQKLMTYNGVIFKSDTEINAMPGMTLDKPFEDTKIVNNSAYCIIGGEGNIQAAKKALEELGKESPVFGNKEIIRSMKESFQSVEEKLKGTLHPNVPDIHVKGDVFIKI